MADAYARRKFETLVAAAFADGFLAEPEKEVLQQKASALGLSLREVHETLGMGQQRKLTIALPATSLERDQMLEDLIDVVAADGRVEPPEYALLARFAELLKIGMPDLRQRVNRRMQAQAAPRTQVRKEPPRAPAPPPPVRSTQTRPLPPPPPPRPAPARPGPAVEAAVFESPKFPEASAPSISRGPAMMESSLPAEPKVGNLPPVTLQLLKQSIMFDNEGDSIVYIGRTLGIPPSEAATIRSQILAAFPDLKPGSSALGSNRL